MAGTRTTGPVQEDSNPRDNRKEPRERERRPRGRNRRQQQETDVKPPRGVSRHKMKESGGPLGYVRPGSQKREDRPRTMTVRRRRTRGQELETRKKETVEGSEGQTSVQEG